MQCMLNQLKYYGQIYSKCICVMCIFLQFLMFTFIYWKSSGKKRRLTLIECPNDINSMIDVGKIADVVSCHGYIIAHTVLICK